MGKRRKSNDGRPPVSAADYFEGETGSPIYHVPMPPAGARLRFIAGQLEAVDPDAPTAANRPLVPSSDELAKLPRLSGFAFVARSARRVWPLACAALVSCPKDAEAVAQALDLTEAYANGQGEPALVTKAAREAIQAAANALAASSAAVDAVLATHHAADAVREQPGGVFMLCLAVEYAVKAITHAATVETPIHRQLFCIRRDFDRLAALAKKHNWADDTPVPPDMFGPMWPAHLRPDWAKEQQ